MRPDSYGRLPAVDRFPCLLLLPALAWGTVFFLYFCVVPDQVSSLKLPGPWDVCSAQTQIGWDLLTHAGSTLFLVVVGFFVGSTLGVVMGFVMFARRSVEVTLFSFIEVIRPIPPIALTPFFILWFQLSVIGQIALVAVGCMMVMVVSTHESLQSVALDLRRSAYSLGIRGFAFYRHIMLPAIAPQLVAPLRVALALAFALAVAAEFMGAQQGIGFLMMVARRTLQTETILMGVMVLGVLSAALDYILRLIFRRVNRWQA